jgi:hypothetical protein
MALKYVARGSRILDIGTHDGTLLTGAGATGVGIDPELLITELPPAEDVLFVKGFFPADLPPGHGPFDAATALAVMEHVPEQELASWEAALRELVATGGRVVITVPSPLVDRILHVLMALRLVAGIEAHQHHGFEPGDIHTLFQGPAWRRVTYRRFQLGLNNLFVFERTSTPPASPMTA